MTNYTHKRFLKNYLLQPLIQLRVGFAGILLMTVGFGLLTAFIYSKMANFTDVVTTLTQSDEAIQTLIRDYIRSTGWMALAIVVVTIILNTAVTIYFTHKMVGPTVAFRRHISQLEKGVYEQRVKLRKGDAFVEVADDLNKLAKALEERHGGQNKKSA